MLAALVLSCDHYSGGLVGYAHCGVRGVDVLTARAAGPVGIYLEFGFVDLYFYVVINLRENKYGGE
jgi:hypothetical protein